MVDFRRWILALAVLALFAGLASAQNEPLSCATNVTSVPQLRAEGLTEQIGDIKFTCTGGNPVAAGAPVATVNISIFLNTNVTSRLFSTNPNVSEALLLIDEPGGPGVAPIPGFGIAAPQSVCPTPTTGCPEVAGPIGGTEVNAPPASQTVAGFNVFQGIVNPDGIHPNLITFFGIPVLPPASPGLSRIFRITNIRANATIFGLVNVGTINATISVSQPTAFPITNANPLVGFVLSGLSATPATTTPATFSACLGGTAAGTVTTTLTFRELFGTAFKTRVDPTTNAVNAQAVPTNQNIPGQGFNSESGFVIPVPSGGTAGLADFGTRLKATFHGLPTGATLTVSLTNTDVAGVNQGTAALVTSETVSDGTNGTDELATSGLITADAAGNATAVWEIITTFPNALETLTFSAVTVFPANTQTVVTTPVTVNLSFAPTTATTTLIPRFIDSSSAAGVPILNVNVCRTILLYPFVTDATGSGFDTGIAIANTSADPFNTAPQSGTCTLSWFGAATATASNPVSTQTTPTILSGNEFTMILSNTPALANFTGYMIAACNFQYAHGFAFISDLGARNFAMGYLALVLPDPNTNSSGRVASPGAQAASGSGESVSQ